MSEQHDSGIAPPGQSFERHIVSKRMQLARTLGVGASKLVHKTRDLLNSPREGYGREETKKDNDASLRSSISHDSEKLLKVAPSLFP